MATLHELGRRLGLRVGWDEARQGRENDPALMILPGGCGHVFVWSRTELAFSTTPKRGLKLARQVGGTVRQDGSDGVNVSFAPGGLPEVAKALRIYRRRVLTPEQRAKSAERLAAYRFVSRTSESVKNP